MVKKLSESFAGVLLDVFGKGKENTSEFKKLQQTCHQGAKDKGFWDNARNESELLMLTVTELGECCEALRKGNGKPSEHIPDFTGAEEELADAVIRIMDMSEGCGFRLEEAILAKLKFNKTREKLHGKNF